MKFGALVVCANEWRFMPAVLGQLNKHVDRIVVVRNQTSLAGVQLQLIDTPDLSTIDKLDRVITGTWKNEHETRNIGIEALQDCDYIFTIDSDEILSDRAFAVLKESCAEDSYAVYGGCHTYWKTAEWRIDPPEKIMAPLLVSRDARFKHIRNLEQSDKVILIPQYVFHHLSYVRTDDEMKKKITSFGHAKEVVPGWYQRIWKGWDENHAIEDLHPTHPAVFKRAVPADGSVTSILKLYGVS